MNNKKVLILTAPFGNGHKMVAKALYNTFIDNDFTNVRVEDVFTKAHPVITKTIKNTYLKSYNYGKAYSFAFYGVEKLVDKKIMDVYKYFGYTTLKKIIDDFHPDVIINTFPILASTKIKERLELDIPIFTTITDFCVHKLWIDENIDKFYVATNDLQKHLNELNIPITKTVVTGIPIREAFEQKQDISGLYKKYNFDSKKSLILINAGAFGVMSEINEICSQLCKDTNIEIAVACGNNKKLKESLDCMNIENLRAFGFTDDIHELYKISTCMITKPGGITLSEALAENLPLILLKPVPGQENENALFFQSKNAAIITYDKEELIEKTKYITSNPHIIKNMKDSMNDLYNAYSCKKIVEDISLELSL